MATFSKSGLFLWLLPFVLLVEPVFADVTIPGPDTTADAPATLPAPAVDIAFPHEGEVVDTPKVAFALTFQQDLAIDANSVAIQQAGRTLRTQCRSTEGGAVCVLDEPLEEGEVAVEVSAADGVGNLLAPTTRTFVVDPTFAMDWTPEGEESETTSEESAEPEGTEITYTPIASPRGIHPEKVYHAASDIDHVDTSSGNLSLRVPLGQSYSVGPFISYQFTLNYNSNIWNHIETGCPPTGCPSPLKPITFALPSVSQNAGLGWEMHFGRLFAPSPPSEMDSFQKKRWPNLSVAPFDAGQRWMYVAPDGGVHHLFDLAGRNVGTANQPIRYTKDGSYLRMRQINGSLMHIEFPDGRISEFEKTNSAAGTLFCGGNAGNQNATGCWRFKGQKDAYGNRMSVTYSINGSLETWNVSDSTGRVHYLTFNRSDNLTGGGDGGTIPPFTTAEGDEWGDPVRVLTKVDLAAFGGSRAVYNLSYHNERISRGCPHDEDGQLPSSTYTQRMPFLDQISQPAGTQPWRFDYVSGSANLCSYFTGRLDEVTLPTRGKVQYQWAINKWDTPTRCSYENDPDAEFFNRSTGIFKRKEVDAGGQVKGTWTYTSQLFPPQDQLVRSGSGCTRATYRETEVSSPAGYDGVYKKIKFFSSVTIGPEVPNSGTPISNWQVTDNGLPLVKAIRISSTGVPGGGNDTNRRFLSRRTFECLAAASGGCAPKRDIWVRYASEWRPCSKLLGDGPGCYKSNPMRTAQHTRYQDDSNRYTDLLHVWPDGAGHFEKSTLTDNFAGPLNTRTTETLYGATGSTRLVINPTTGYVNVGTPSSYLPNPPAPWILTPTSRMSVTENGRTYTQDHVFNNKGSLTCIRKRKNAGAQGSNDQVVKLTLGTAVGTNAGLPVTEIVAGGDQASLGSGACNVSAGTSAGSKYQFDHVYQDYSLKSTRIGTFPYRYRADIDQNTGLPTATYSPADLQTTYQFDALSRPTRITPSQGNNPPHGEAATWITYSNPSNGDPSITTQRLDGGSILTSDVVTYDWNGRPIRERTQRPTSPNTSTQSEVRTLYDPAGRVERVTTLQNSPSSIGLATVYSQYDAFDRPKRIVRPDGTDETRSYLGVRQSNSTVRVRTSETGSTTSTTTTTLDAQGRTVKIGNPIYSTSSTYDPAGNMLSVTRQGGGQSQTRSYGYDGRGFLLSENLPEIDGVVTYTRDAFGLVRKKSSGPFNLTYVYDNAGRLTQLKDTFGGRVWKEWQWGTSNQGNNLAKGQLIRAVRHNYPYGVDWSVVETYAYAGIGGRQSEKTSQIQWPANPVADRYGTYFSTNFTYDPLGNLSALTYPRCLPTPQNGQNRCTDGTGDQTAPAHTLNHTYSSGMHWRAQSTLGPWAQATYHPNLQLATLDYKNEIQGVFDQGTHGMNRGRRYRYLKDGVVRFGNGFMEYDGAGNLWQIGGDRYVYDKASRLMMGTVVNAPGFNRKEEYTYDAFDNIETMRRDGGAWQIYNIQTSKNRLIGNNDIVYNGAGHMLEVGPYSGGHPRYEMEYDPYGMQTRFVSRETSTPIEHLYLYGPNDRRLVTYNTATGEREFKLRGLGDEVLREYSVTGWGSAVNGQGGEGWVHVKDFLYGPEGVFATRTRAGNDTYLHKDHLGTPRLLTDDDGDEVGRHDYYPFGLEIPRSGQADEPTKKYTGHERDPNGRADYMLGRTYLYPFMRFATPDPARDGWSLYAYTGNNPVNYVDPDGEVVETLWDAANVAMGFDSLVDNLSEGNYLAASLDAAGLVVDLAATTLPAVPGGAGTLIKAGRAADRLGDGVQASRHAERTTDSAQIARRGDLSGNPRFVAGENAHQVIDTSTTPAGRYIQPDGSATDILQSRDHPGLEAFDSRTHTHDATRHVNPSDPSRSNLRLNREPRPVSPEDVKNILDGKATRGKPRGRS